MDTRKLDSWAEKLLDTGKGNNMINFRDSKSLSVDVLIPSAGDVFKKIDSGAVLEVVDPKIPDEDDDIIEESDNAEDPLTGRPQDKKAEYIFAYAGRIKKQSQILVFNQSANPLNAVKNIFKRSSQAMEDTGVNVVYMAFGSIHWKESDSSHITFRAPVLLVPVKIEHESAGSPYHIKSTGDDVIVNPTFTYKIDAEYGMRLPEYDDESLDEYLSKVKSLVSRLRWAVSDECRLGVFSFQKINMYQDLKENSAEILKNKNVKQILGEQEAPGFSYGAKEETRHLENPLIELHSVVDADSSQIEAIEMAKSGRSFVLQGPPGTGKSQTITNIIAECLNDGKKVLFVSEKQAALNVVYNKLKQAGLAEFCLELHSHKANKKAVIDDLCESLTANPSGVRAKAVSEIEIKKKNQKKLDDYALELHKERPVIEESLYKLYEKYAALREVPEVEWIVPDIGSKGKGYISEVVQLLEQYSQYQKTIGYNYKNNPWYGYINRDTSYQARHELKNNLQAVTGYIRELMPIAVQIASRYSVPVPDIAEAGEWRRFLKFASRTKLAVPMLMRADILDKAKSNISRMQELEADITANKEVLDSVFSAGIYRLDGCSLFNKLAVQYKGFFSRIFSSEYKSLIGSIRLCARDGRKMSYTEALNWTERLKQYQDNTRAFYELETQVKEPIGEAYSGLDTDWEYVVDQLDILKTCIASGTSYGSIAGYNHSSFSLAKTEFADFADRLDGCSSLISDEIEQLSKRFDPSVININKSGIDDVLKKCEACLEAFDDIDNWCGFRDLMEEISGMQAQGYIDRAIADNIAPGQYATAFRKLFYHQWIDMIIRGSEVLSGFSRISQDNAVENFARTDREQFDINKAMIRSELSSRRPGTSVSVQGSPVSVLLREGAKKRRQKSIRKLLEEVGETVQLIKPCFLMSPLSVSTYLASNSVHFDVVVFDEASQIFPQDAIGAIYRADQLIVVGDSKQMPPSDFFNAITESDDVDEEIGDIGDFESILDICAASMPQISLRWHYRSRYEHLIMFSNKNFYGNNLITFPSSRKDEKGIGVDYYHVDGVFDRRSHTNRKEAEFVVDLIYQNIEEHPERSLGVIAFSRKQQDLIDKLLSRRQLEHPEEAEFFSAAKEEPFFVKNLESVQGDERDTIIFSVAYGIDAQGRTYQNFGPLNRKGGERRLNVAVTRAKCNVQLVSSMHYTDVLVKEATSTGARLLREYLNFAEIGEAALDNAIRVNNYDEFDSDFEMEVCEFLRDNGFTVDTQVGCSGYRIDLGVRLPDSSNYVLAVECDGATYHSSKNARDRDRLRQEVLERMGWKFHRIWSTDWFRNKASEKRNLLLAAKAAVFGAENKTSTSAEQDISDSHGNEEENSFEEKASVRQFEFPRYHKRDIAIISSKTSKQYFTIVKRILETEAPLSEEWLLSRTVAAFGEDKVNSSAKNAFDFRMRYCGHYGIESRNGFLYLEGKIDYVLRVPKKGDTPREIKYISLEELAAGLLELIKQNLTVEKKKLYKSLATLLGAPRMTKTINARFDEALGLLDGRIYVNEDMIYYKATEE